MDTNHQISKYEVIQIIGTAMLYEEKMSREYCILGNIKKCIELLPQSSSVESLLGEMPYGTQLIFMGTYWMAQTVYHSTHGGTPLEALLSLREKLSTNQ